MQLSCRIFGILEKEITQALNLIPKWHLSSLLKKKTNKRCVSKKRHDGQNEFMVLV